MQEARAPQLKKFRFTPKQENFLANHPTSFHIYWKLIYEEWTQEQILETFAITKADIFKHLRALDQHELVQLMPDGNIRRPDMNMMLWEDTGPIVAKIRKEWTASLLKKVLANKGESGFHLHVRYFQLRPETATEFVKAVEDLELEFGRRSLRETRLSRAETIPVSMMAAFAPRSFVEEL